MNTELHPAKEEPTSTAVAEALGDGAIALCASCPMQRFCKKQGGSETPVCEPTVVSYESSTGTGAVSYTRELEDPSIPVVFAKKQPSVPPVATVVRKQTPEKAPVKSTSQKLATPVAPVKKISQPAKAEKSTPPRPVVGSLVAQFVCKLLLLESAA